MKTKIKSAKELKGDMYAWEVNYLGRDLDMRIGHAGADILRIIAKTNLAILEHFEKQSHPMYLLNSPMISGKPEFRDCK